MTRERESGTRRFEGRVVIVTGAASGIGLASAQRFLAEGARVLAVDLDEASLDWTSGIDDAVPFRGSAAVHESNKRMAEAAMDTWGRIDVAHLNAGIMPSSSIAEGDLAILDDVLAVNLKGVAYGVHAVLPHMAAGGSFVVTNSTAGLGGDAMGWAYSASKGGALNLVRSVAAEVGHKGIRINAVCPGPTLTAAAAAIRVNLPELFDAYVRNVPMRRWADPAEVAAAVAFLASEDASFITGVALPVDGGATSTTGVYPLPGDAVTIPLP